MTTDCCSACPTPEIVETPGSPGEDGAAGAAGAAGVSAFTTLTASLTIPAAPGPVVAPTTVANSTWMAIGQVLFISDGTNWGHFRVLTKPSSLSVTLTWLNYEDDAVATTVIANAGIVSPSGTQPPLSAALPTAITDNSTGTASDTIAAGAGVQTIPLYVNLADIAAADLLTAYTPGYKFKLLSISFAVEKAVTTAAKLATLTPKISGVAVTGGVLSLTSANCTPQGTVLAATAITALNTGSNSATISITGSVVTTFIEGGGWIMIKIQNMDTADAIASLSDHVNDLIVSLT